MTDDTEETVNIAGKPVSIRGIVNEMPVSEYRQWLKDYLAAADEAFEAGDAYDAIEWKLFEGFRLSDVEWMTDLKASELEDLKPSEIEKVFSVCKKVNPHFFGLKERANLFLSNKP